MSTQRNAHIYGFTIDEPIPDGDENVYPDEWLSAQRSKCASFSADDHGNIIGFLIVEVTDYSRGVPFVAVPPLVVNEANEREITRVRDLLGAKGISIGPIGFWLLGTSW